MLDGNRKLQYRWHKSVKRCNYCNCRNDSSLKYGRIEIVVVQIVVKIMTQTSELLRPQGSSQECCKLYCSSRAIRTGTGHSGAAGHPPSQGDMVGPREDLLGSSWDWELNDPLSPSNGSDPENMTEKVSFIHFWWSFFFACGALNKQ